MCFVLQITYTVIIRPVIIITIIIIFVIIIIIFIILSYNNNASTETFQPDSLIQVYFVPDNASQVTQYLTTNHFPRCNCFFCKYISHAENTD
jgi:hypothetical protein